MKHIVAVSLFVLALSISSLPAADWPQWRGPAGQGHSTAKNLPLTWSETENIVWRTEIPGRAWSSPVIDGQHIWMTTAVESEASVVEKAKKLADNFAGQPLNIVGKLSLRGVCVDRVSGKVIHDVELLTAESPDPVHQLNSFASPSPTLEDGRLYAHFGTNGTACLDVKTQKILWTNRELKLKHENGPGSTPVLWGQLLIVHCDGSDTQSIAALDKQSGKVVWRTDRSGEMDPNPQLKKAYGTPLVTNVGGREAILSPAANWLYAYEPESGRELWKLSYGTLGFSIVPRPVVGHGMVFVGTSFMKPEILAVTLDDKPKIAWRYNKQAPTMPSPLLVGDELYFVTDKGVATCLDAKSGQANWSERLGGNFCSSLLFADGRILIGNREGQTFVIAPGKSYKLLATNQLDGQIMATPAAVDADLFVRTDKALYRIAAK
ncbi:MAG: PQQ-binding-like beta-propeller repeat protein [Planctomycetaceae bacterium]